MIIRSLDHPISDQRSDQDWIAFDMVVLSSYHHMTISPYHHISIISSYDHVIISSCHHINITPPMLDQDFKISLATFWRIQPIGPGFGRILIRFAQIPGRSAEFAQKWRVDFSNFKWLKNREDGSDFDDSWTKTIAATRSSFWKIFAPSKKFSLDRSGPRSVWDRSEIEDRTGTGPASGTDPTDRTIIVFDRRVLLDQLASVWLVPPTVEPHALIHHVAVRN